MKKTIFAVFAALLLSAQSFSQTNHTQLVPSGTFWKIVSPTGDTVGYAGTASQQTLDASKKVINDIAINTDLTDANSATWAGRLYVEKKWLRVYEVTAKKETGTDYLMLMFNTNVTLKDACGYAKDLERSRDFGTGTNKNHYSSLVSAWVE